MLLTEAPHLLAAVVHTHQAKAAAEARQLQPTPRQVQQAAAAAAAVKQRPTVITRLPEQFSRQVHCSWSCVLLGPTVFGLVTPGSWHHMHQPVLQLLSMLAHALRCARLCTSCYATASSFMLLHEGVISAAQLYPSSSQLPLPCCVLTYCAPHPHHPHSHHHLNTHHVTTRRCCQTQCCWWTSPLVGAVQMWCGSSSQPSSWTGCALGHPWRWRPQACSSYC
jgi:hypothetical protein